MKNDEILIDQLISIKIHKNLIESLIFLLTMNNENRNHKFK